MSTDAMAKLVVKAGVLATITAVIMLAGNTEAGLAFKQIKDSLMSHVHHR
ncbi:MAG TPA: hypothetical protein V6D08_11605 [Candidatus Obscuribacterales bacterium]